LRQVHSLFQTEFSEECDPELPPSTATIFLLPLVHPTCVHLGNVGATLRETYEQWLTSYGMQRQSAAIYSTHCVNKTILCPRNNDVDISKKVLDVCDMLKLKTRILQTAKKKKKGISSVNLEVIYNFFFLL
jgi:hypothetical protein